MRCKYCNAEIKDGLAFCTQCGKKLSVSKQVEKEKEELVESSMSGGCGCFLILILIILFICLYNCLGINNSPVENKSPVAKSSIPMTSSEANELVYSKNVKALYGIGTAVAERAVQQRIQREFNEKLEFYGVMWSMTCVDPMKLGLYTYKNKFKGEISKREHSYSFRFGINKLVNGGEPKVYYISVDGETWYFNEDGEDRFMSASERALKREEEKLTKPTSSK